MGKKMVMIDNEETLVEKVGWLINPSLDKRLIALPEAEGTALRYTADVTREEISALPARTSKNKGNDCIAFDAIAPK